MEWVKHIVFYHFIFRTTRDSSNEAVLNKLTCITDKLDKLTQTVILMEKRLCLVEGQVKIYTEGAQK